MTKKVVRFFEEKYGDNHQLPPRVSPTLVTPLQATDICQGIEVTKYIVGVAGGIAGDSVYHYVTPSHVECSQQRGTTCVQLSHL